jgi:hypothetical protein
MSAIENIRLYDFSSCSRTTRSVAFWSVEYEISSRLASASQMRRALTSE